MRQMLTLANSIALLEAQTNTTQKLTFDTGAKRRLTECTETVPEERKNVKGKPMIVSKTVNLTRSEQRQRNKYFLALGSW
jgi:hypothetical protein